MIQLLRHGPASFTVLSYAAAVAILTWATSDGHLGDHLYGWILMMVLAFPASLLDVFFGDQVRHALVGESPGDGALGYVVFAWPGLLMALLMISSLAARRARRVVRVASWVLTGVVALCGVTITLDQWAPRRPYGWPFAVCAAGMAAGLILSRRADGGGNSSGHRR